MGYIDPRVKKVYNQRYYLKKKKTQSAEQQERKIPLNLRLPETLLGRIQRVTLEGLATGKYPWKSTTECITNLLQRGFSTLKGDPFIDEMLPHLEMSQHLDRIQTLRREAQTILNKARTEIGELLAIHAKPDAITYFHVTMEAARKMPPTIWRDWLIGQLRNAFPALAKEKPIGVNLMGPGKKIKKAARR